MSVPADISKLVEYFANEESAEGRRGDNDGLTTVEAAIRLLRERRPVPAKREGAWQCNECGSNEFTGSVSHDDACNMDCGQCGGDEFHWVLK